MQGVTDSPVLNGAKLDEICLEQERNGQAAVIALRCSPGSQDVSGTHPALHCFFLTYLHRPSITLLCQLLLDSFVFIFALPGDHECLGSALDYLLSLPPFPRCRPGLVSPAYVRAPPSIHMPVHSCLATWYRLDLGSAIYSFRFTWTFLPYTDFSFRLHFVTEAISCRWLRHCPHCPQVCPRPFGLFLPVHVTCMTLKPRVPFPLRLIWRPVPPSCIGLSLFLFSSHFSVRTCHVPLLFKSALRQLHPRCPVHASPCRVGWGK